MTLGDQTELREYPLVRNLLGAIFNQDWREEHDCVEEVYEDLLDGEPRHARLARAAQIEAFVANRSEDEVDDVFRASGTGRRPRSDLGVSSREWLLAVVQRLRAQP
ncbi:contact-dependent growth inhibition system immunity protein [Curtobacterium sp. RHCJP20]|uniref:Contact-dependent growth inhibition system immunity protein n=1 Tax=Curtobacterium subtropicum TaxID=3055138 RepID=A0ABT7TCN4_9MICO|nr:contact-dependent growth inhibition system immunity protein [Curtobacterium subtropicum]MDM7887330.1 contact-dependent growth inhibition system immunity protein [Curtobacterium subtropicum]